MSTKLLPGDPIKVFSVALLPDVDLTFWPSGPPRSGAGVGVGMFRGAGDSLI